MCPYVHSNSFPGSKGGLGTDAAFQLAFFEGRLFEINGRVFSRAILQTADDYEKAETSVRKSLRLNGTWRRIEEGQGLYSLVCSGFRVQHSISGGSRVSPITSVALTITDLAAEKRIAEGKKQIDELNRRAAERKIPFTFRP